MTFRCPYCRKTFSEHTGGKCPFCKRFMRMPERMKSHLKKRGNATRPIEDNDTGLPPILIANSGRSPRTALIALALLILAGGALILQSMKTLQPDQSIPHRVLTATREMQAMRIALERFKADCGRYPDPEAEGLPALVVNPGIGNWNGPYLNIMKRDPWNSRYIYELTNDSEVILYSTGPDRTPGTQDDLHADTPEPNDIKRTTR